VNAIATTGFLLILLAISESAYGEPGFDPKYERNDNIFNPTNQFRPDNPLNPADRFNLNNPFNPVNQFVPNNPFNPTNDTTPLTR